MAQHFTKAGDYFVSSLGGNDSNAGTDPNAPMKTIAAAITAAEAAGSGYGLTVVIGTGVYNERLVAGTTTDYLVIQGDGNVIIDGTGEDSSIYNGNYWKFNDLTFINCGVLWNGNTNYYPARFTRCKFKNIPGFASSSPAASFKLTKQSFHDCVFDGMYNVSAGIYYRWFTFFNCTFINGQPTSDGALDGSGYGSSWFNCIFFSASGSMAVINQRYPFLYGPELSNCVFSPGMSMLASDADDYSTKHEITQDFLDSNPKTTVNCYVASMSFNDNVTGSGAFNLIENTMPVNATTKDLYNLHGIVPALNTAGGFGPRTAYGNDASSANPLHTDGGATWANIITGSLGGFQISASVAPSGTITTAVIDQGTTKIVKSIGSAWTTTAANAAAPSTYPSGALNHNPTRYQYEMRYGNSTPAGDYKIFEWDQIPYVNSNGTGSGDQLFDTGSFTNVSARYLQLKITLRNDMSGSV